MTEQHDAALLARWLARYERRLQGLHGKRWSLCLQEREDGREVRLCVKRNEVGIWTRWHSTPDALEAEVATILGSWRE